MMNDPLIFEYGLLALAALTILGLLVILHRSVEKHARQYPPELGDSLLRLWEVLGSGAEKTINPWDEELHQVADPLVRAILKQLQEQSVEIEKREESSDVEESGVKAGQMPLAAQDK